LAPVGGFLVQELLSLLLPTLLKLLSEPRKESVPATPRFSELLITIQPLLVFPNFKNRHHMNAKKSRGKKFLKACALQDNFASF